MIELNYLIIAFVTIYTAILSSCIFQAFSADEPKPKKRASRTKKVDVVERFVIPAADPPKMAKKRKSRKKVE